MAPQTVATVVFHGDLQRFGRRFTLYVTTAGEAIHALVMQLPGLRAHISPGHYQLRVAGSDVSESSLARRLNEPLPDGAVVHLVPRVRGAAKGGLIQTIAGAALIVAGVAVSVMSFGSASLLGGAMISAGIGMMVGGVIQMLTPVPKTPGNTLTDNGKQHTYYSSLDNAVAQGNALPVVYGEMVVGSRVISQELMVWDE
jgi:predicted phage tail protein